MSDKPFAVTQIDHVELFVPDQQKAAVWYEQTLGLKSLPKYAFWADGGPLMISSDNGQTMLALFQGEPIGFNEPVGYRRVAFRVAATGFLTFLDRLKTYPVHHHNSDLAYQLDPVDHDLAFSVYFCDPDGNRFEVTTYEYEAVKSMLEKAGSGNRARG